MTGIFRLIIMSVIAYVVYAVLRRFLQPFMNGPAAARPPQQGKARKYSPKDGAVDADFEEIE